MKKRIPGFVIAFAMTCIAGVTNGQTVLLNEDFSSGSLPAGWSQDSAGVTPFFTWTFNNPAGRIITGAAFDADFVIFDSEFYDQGNSEDCYLNLPAVNASTLTALYLVMDEQYQDWVDGFHQIDVSTNGGLSWTGIVSDSDATDLGYPDAVHSIYDITSLAAGQSNVMIRFHYASTWGYWWAIDNVTIVDSLPNAPANDDCTSPTSLPVGSTCSPTSFTIGIANNSGNPGCNGGVADDDVWFSFVANGSSCLMQLTSANGLNHHVELFDGCGGTSLDCINNGSPGLTSLITGLTNGNTYYLSVYTTDFAVYDITNLDICLLTPPSPPVNDNCSGNVPLTVSSGCVTTSGTLSGSTDSGIPGCSGEPDDDVWYSFIASDSIVSISVAGHGQNDPVIEVFDTCNAGSSIACIDNISGKNESGFAGSLTIGNTYYFRVYSYDIVLLDSSDFEVCVRNVAFPQNDDCANAILINEVATEFDCNLSTLAVTDWATASSPPPPSSCSLVNYSDDVWYYFVASHDTMTVSAFNLSPDIAPFGVGFTLYDSSCAGVVLDCLNPATDNMMSMDSLIIGRSYFFRTFSADISSTGSFNMCLFGGLFTHVQDKNMFNDFHLFPDPTTGILNLSFDSRLTKTIVRVIDLIGNPVREEVMQNTGKTTVDLSSLPNGVYFVKMENEKGLITRKVILNR